MKGYYTTAEAAKKLGVTPQRVDQHRLAGRLHGERVGRSWLYPADEVNAFRKPLPVGRPRKEAVA